MASPLAWTQSHNCDSGPALLEEQAPSPGSQTRVCCFYHWTILGDKTGFKQIIIIIIIIIAIKNQKEVWLQCSHQCWKLTLFETTLHLMLGSEHYWETNTYRAKRQFLNRTLSSGFTPKGQHLLFYTQPPLPVFLHVTTTCFLKPSAVEFTTQTFSSRVISDRI